MHKLLKVADVAKLLDVSEGRVYELARRGILPHIRLGRQVRFSPIQLKEFLEGGGQSLAGGWRNEA